MIGNEKPIIAIRADGNETIGLGHLMRCMSIGKALEKQGAQCVFFVAQEQAGVYVRDRGFACEVLDTNYQDMESELPRLKKLVEEFQPGLWLVDSYQISQRYLRELQSIGPVFYLDDTGEQLYEANGLINYNIYGEELCYESRCHQQMKFLLGTEFAPVKEEFIQTEYGVREEVQNVLITMGGSDKLNITEKFSQCLLKRLPEKIGLTLICGRFNPHLQKLLQLQEGNERIKVLVDVPDMWNKLAQADVVVAAAGSTMYELGAMGVPTVCCYYVENQRRIAEGFATKVGMCNAGDFSKEPEAVLERMVEGVCQLVKKKEARINLSGRMRQAVSGHGTVRIAEELLKVVKRAVII